MDNKIRTLQTIYELVKDDTNPLQRTINPSEIIVRQNIPWDEIVKHLNQLHADGFINMKQLSIAAISITEQGIHEINPASPVMTT